MLHENTTVIKGDRRMTGGKNVYQLYLCPWLAWIKMKLKQLIYEADVRPWRSEDAQYSALFIFNIGSIAYILITQRSRSQGHVVHEVLFKLIGKCFEEIQSKALHTTVKHLLDLKVQKCYLDVVLCRFYSTLCWQFHARTPLKRHNQSWESLTLYCEIWKCIYIFLFILLH